MSRGRTSAGMFLAGIGWVGPIAAGQAIRYVVPVNAGAAPPFMSWATAATNIQDAVDAAAPGDTVRVTDGEELRAGTDPLDASSFLGLLNLRRQTPGLVVQWQSVSGKAYTLARSTNLLQHVWTPIGTNIPGVAPMNTATDTTAVGNRPWLYRIELK